MQLGFSYIGFLFLLLLFIPNIFWTKNKPSGYEQSTEDESRILLVLERTGEILVTCTALIFSDFNFHPLSRWSFVARRSGSLHDSLRTLVDPVFPQSKSTR